MNVNEFSLQIKVWRSQLAGLLEGTHESAAPEKVLNKAFEELHAALEKLTVAEKQLRQQNHSLENAQKLLQAERCRYQELLEFAPDAYLLTDHNGVIEEGNSAAAILLNVSPYLLVGKLLVTFIPLAERQSFRSHLNKLHRQEKLHEWEIRLKPRKCEPVEVAITMAAVRDRSGNLIAVRWLLRDISERKLLELERIDLLAREQQARKEAEVARARMTSILTSITDAFVTIDTQWRYTYVNSQAEKLLGKSASELTGLIVWEVFPDTVNSQSYTLFHQAVEQQVSVTYEEFFPIFNKWFAVRLYPSSDGLSVYFLDITEHKQTEKALRQSEAQFRRLVESNIFGSTVMDFLGNITQANDAFLLMVGYTKEDLRAGKLQWIDMTPKGYLSLDKQAIAQVKKSGSCNPYEKEFICKDGSRVPILIGMALLEGCVDCCICFVLDLTPTKQLEKALRQQAAQLAQANRTKDEFLAVVSHELRSPLSAILGWVQTLQNGSLNPATTARAIEKIEHSTRAQIQLVENLLDISQIITGKLEMNLVSIPLAPIIEAAIDHVRSAADTKQIQLHSNLDPRVGRVLGDPKRLQQIILNLLSNAIKFTPKCGRVEVRLSLTREAPGKETSKDTSCHPQQSVAGILPILSSELNSSQSARLAQHSVILEVIDTGIGISSEFIPFVFDRFRQADSTITRSYGGMGLGLAIVCHLVQMHGGTIRVASPGVGLGTTFTVELPCDSI
ncbi:PAS domain S-box protein [Tolypothrix campylonemoides VB511288]|nr:PAS domain S-box protein [Tolypothrix campylonemoides VB511288]